MSVIFKTEFKFDSRALPTGKNYLVKVDNKGLLRWDRNDKLVDTTDGEWQDSGDGTGIQLFSPSMPSSPSRHRRASFEDTGSISSSAVSARSELVNGGHYSGEKNESNPVKRFFRERFTIKGMTDRLLRKTLRRNTWIYVSVRKGNNTNTS